MKFFQSNFLVFLCLLCSVSFARAQDLAETNPDLTVIKLKVKGITCSMDLKMISDEVEAVTGVSECKSIKDGAVSVFRIEYNSEEVTEAQIRTAIERTGGCENPKEKPYKVKK